MIVREHEVSFNVMGYIMNTVKTWVIFFGDTFQCQMEPEKIADKDAVAVIKKDKAPLNLTNWKML